MASERSLAQSLLHLESGGLLAFPTETVWGLAARADSEPALERLRAWKGRDANRPLSLLVSGPESLASLGFVVSRQAADLMATFWPGPLTLVLPCGPRFARGVARGDGAVGVRCSPHPAASALAAGALEAGWGPITATSLNRSGEPAARNDAEARRWCEESVGVDAIPIYHGGCDAGGSCRVRSRI